MKSRFVRLTPSDAMIVLDNAICQQSHTMFAHLAHLVVNELMEGTDMNIMCVNGL